MKHIYSTAIALFFFLFSFAAPTNTVIVNNGKWNQASTWSLGRLPIDGDTVVVPSNITLIIDNNVNNNDNLYLRILGSLNFQVGKLDLGPNSVIFIPLGGSISSSNNNSSDYIKIGGVRKFNGAEGLISGPVLANSVTGVSPLGFTSIGNISLPVRFLGFNIARQNNDVLVQWSTAQEINSARFEIERSEDGTAWNTIATITAAGNSTSVQSYSFTDRNVTIKTAYYRIKQIDIDGRSTYTAVKSIKNTVNAIEAKVAAVAKNQIVLQFNQQIKSTVAVRIISLNGQIIAQQNLNQPVGQVIVNTNNLKGNYIVSITNNQDVNTHTQILF
jgi:hypothetical protein